MEKYKRLMEASWWERLTEGETGCCPEVEQFYEDLQDLLELTPKKGVLFIIGDWSAKVRSQEITWSNRQVWTWSTEWSRAKANRVFPRECTGHSKHPLPTTQEEIHTWTSPGVNTKIKLIIYMLCSQRWRSSIQSAKTRLGAQAQIMNSLLPNSDLNWRT